MRAVLLLLATSGLAYGFGGVGNPAAETLTFTPEQQYNSRQWPSLPPKVQQLLMEGHTGAAMTAGLSEVLRQTSAALGDVGLSLTVFDSTATQVFHETVGSQGCEDLDCDKTIKQFNSTSVIPVYSHSKAVTTVVFLASVVQQGLAGLDDPLAELLPDIFGRSNASGSSVTPRQIFSHTSGITGEQFPAECAPLTQVSLEACAEWVASAPLAFEPGTSFLYSNVAFQLIALVVEKLTGMSFEQAFQTYVAVPLQMHNSTFSTTLPQCERSIPGNPQAASGLCTTPTDMPKFVQMLQLGGKVPGGSFLDEDLVRDMLTGKPVEGETARMFAGFMNPLFTISESCKDADGATVFDYRLSTMISHGWKSKLEMHLSNLGSVWAVAPNRYSLYLGNVGSMIVSVRAFELILGAFEEQHFPQLQMCPTTEKPESLPLPKDVVLPWQEGSQICPDGYDLVKAANATVDGVTFECVMIELSVLMECLVGRCVAEETKSMFKDTACCEDTNTKASIGSKESSTVTSSGLNVRSFPDV